MRSSWRSVGRTLQALDYSFGWASFWKTVRRAGSQRMRYSPVAQAIETLEPRLLLSTLPLPTISQHQTIGGTTTPSIVVDPADPNKLVAVYANAADSTIDISYAVLDPTLPPNQTPNWLAGGSVTRLPDPIPNEGLFTASDPSVAFDRNGNFYVVALEHSIASEPVNAAGQPNNGYGHNNLEYQAGAVVLQKYSFTGAAPTLTPQVYYPGSDPVNPGLQTENTLYEWATPNSNSVMNPTVAVDGNAATYTDPTTGATQTDPQSGNVYVAWNTHYKGPDNSGVYFNPNVIIVRGSSDGGVTFTPAKTLTASAGSPSSYPRLVVSQGTADGRVQGGQLGIVYDNFDPIAPSDAINFVPVTDGADATSVSSSPALVVADASVPPTIAPTPGQPVPAPEPNSTALTDATLNVTNAGGQFNAFPNITDVQVTISIATPKMDDISLVLNPPAGSGFQPVVLLRNKTTGFGAQTNGVGIVSSGLGIGGTYGNYGSVVGATFTQNATTAINNGQSPFIGLFQPENGNLQYAASTGTTVTITNVFGSPNGLGEFNGATVASILGTWTLTIGDYLNDGGAPDAVLVNWSMLFSSAMTLTNASVTIGNTTVRGDEGTAPSGGVNFPQKVPSSPDIGFGPAASIASDNTLGSFSPFEGRLYVTYVTPANGGFAVSLATSDDGGNAWIATAPAVGGSSGAQFLPEVTVDQATGTLAVTWYDNRYDGAGARVARFIGSSIDGGNTFSPLTYLNTPDSANDGINIGQVIAPEPVPDNISTGNGARDQVTGFGEHEGLAMYDGNIYAVWAGNENLSSGLSILTATATTAGGPRVVTGPYNGSLFVASGDMGPVVDKQSVGSTTVPVTIDETPTYMGDRNTIDPITGRPQTIVYDNTFAADGTRELTGFVISFDRPVAISTFTASQVQVFYHGVNETDPMVPVAVDTPAPLDDTQGFGYGPAAADPLGTFLATTFFVQLATPQSAVGTYSYLVGPTVTDMIRTLPAVALPAPQGDGLGNQMDQNGNAITGENGTTTNGRPGLFDYFAAPRPETGKGLAAPYDPNTLPLIIPGPHLVDTYVSGNPTATQYTIANQTLDASGHSVTVTLPSGADPLAFEAALSLQVTGPAGAVAGPFTTTVVSNTTVTVHLPVGPTYASGPYTISYIPGNPVVLSNLVLDTTAQGVTAVLPYDTDLTKITPASVLQIEGPNGFIAGPFTITPNPPGTLAPAANRTFAIGFPALPVGQSYGQGPYSVKLVPQVDPSVLGLNGKGFNTDNVVLNGTPNGINVVFDRDMNPSSFTAADVLSMTGPAGSITGPFTVTPNPAGTPAALAARTFLITFPQQQVSGNYTIKLASTIVDAQGHAIDQNFNAGVDVLFGGSPSDTTVVTFSNATAAPIQAPAVTSSTIFVPDSFAVSNLSVNLNITYPNDPDLIATLIAPDGVTKVVLFSNVGTTGSANFTGTTLDDNTKTTNVSNITTGTAPFDGTFRSQSFTGALGTGLTAFNGLQAQGNWTLQIASNAGGVAGLLDNWALTFQKSSTIVYSNITAAPIDAPLVTTSSITVPSHFLAHNVAVQLSITYPHDPDLTATLTGPDGTTIILFSGVGNQPGNVPKANFVSTILDDNAATPIQDGTAPFFSSFQPQQSLLTAFQGKDVAGTWTLTITSSAHGVVGSLVKWSLSLQKPVTITGLGEPVGDQSPVSFRIFSEGANNPLSSVQFTPVGGASSNSGGNSGSVNQVVVDPSDPSGNTVYVAAASGGIWKTDNFLTTDPKGPTYVPLTDNGGSNAIDITSMAVFGHNDDPRQSIIIAATGNANTSSIDATGSSPSVGFIRSMDGGATWTLLDSTANVDANGNELPITSPSRDHIFVGANIFKIVLDPRLTPEGTVAMYAAVSGANGGIWRSLDSGNHWARMRSGQATDVVVDQTNYPDAVTLEPGNFNYVYGAFEGDGIYFSPNQGQVWTQMLGGIGNPNVLDGDGVTTVPITTPAGTQPNGAQGRIALAKPSFVDNPSQDTLYQGWLYAVVLTPGTGTNGFLGGGALSGLYVTKDFGHNWTKVGIGVDPFAAGGFADAHGSYDLSLQVDPVNPNIVYMGGTSYSDQSSLYRVDITGMSDGHALYVSNSRADGGQLKPGENDDIKVKSYPNPPPSTLLGTNAVNVYGPNPSTATYPYTGISAVAGQVGEPGLPYQFLDFATLGQDPADPFVRDSLVTVTNIADFNNTGNGAIVTSFTDMLAGSTNLHGITTTIDPLTNKSRLIVGDDEGVFTGVDNADGTVGSIWNRYQNSKGLLYLGINNNDGGLTPGIGLAVSPTGSRNGNLQIAQLYHGAVQPSLAAAIKGAALFYGNTSFNGQPQSDPQILYNGDLNWTGPNPIGSGSGVAADQAHEPDSGTIGGTGTAYHFNWPCCGGNITGFFQVSQPNGGVPTARTFGLFQASNAGTTPDPQWPYAIASNFAVNPINGAQMVVSSQTGNFFASSNQGEFWVLIGDPTSGALDGTYAPTMAFGAPDPNAPVHAPESNFIYAGTTGGHVYVTFTGGGAKGNQWLNISTGLDGSTVQEIVADPIRGSRDAYAVTTKGIYYLANAASSTASWQNITGNVFALTTNLFNNTSLTTSKLQSLATIAVDWRSYIPDAAGNANGASHPTLYVAGDGGVFRSINNGSTWTVFPSVSDGAAVDGGYLPNAHVTDLSLSFGELDPATGLPLPGGGTNVLLASTYGRGSFAIRIASTPIPAPSTPNLTAASDDGVSNTDHITSITQPTFQGAGLPGATVQIFANGTLIGTGTADSNGNYTIQASTPMAFGVYQITARQTDLAGDISPASAAMTPPLVITNGTVYPISGTGFTINVQNEAFVTALYQDILGRTPGAAEIEGWTNTLDAGKSRQYVAFQIASSNEARTITISSDYQRLLGRPPTATETNDQLAFLAAGNTEEALLANIVGSTEYFGRVGSTNAGFVQQAYQDILGRLPTSAEATAGVNYLNAGKSRQTFASNLTATTEYRTNVITATFNEFLKRNPSAAELQNYLNLRLPDEQLTAVIAGSDEFFSLLVINGQPITLANFTDSNPVNAVGDYTATINWGQGQTTTGTVQVNPAGGYLVVGVNPLSLTSTQKVSISILNTKDGGALTVNSKLVVGTINSLFVEQAYSDLLGRAADPTGLTYFTDLLNRGASRNQVVQIILNSDEYRQRQVMFMYQQYLNRTADSTGLTSFSIALQSNTTEQVAAAILGSQEFYNDGGGTNDGFLALLYQRVLGRPIDPTGQAVFSNALNNGATREQVAYAVLTSNEYRFNLVQSYYVQFLNRQGSLNELEGWVSILQAGGKDSDVISGIVGSDEYLANL
jgi:subtilisin-like proprotein convertase family protein